VTRALGWKRDRHDAELDAGDVRHAFQSVRHRMTSAPSSFSLRDRVVEILDQGDAGTCVAHGGFSAIRAAHVAHYLSMGLGLSEAKRRTVLGSRLWGYWFARVPEHATKEDAGCEIRDFYAGVHKLGFPAESHWPYSDSTAKGAPMFKMPPKEAFTAAYDQIGSYHRISSTGDAKIEDVRLAIANGHLVTAGWDVSEEFCNDDPGGSLVDVARPGDAIAGGHCMDLVGYEPDEVLLVQSWGEDWGDHGFFRGTYKWIEQAEDLWIVESVPVYSGSP
jgi:hypothetical protein